MPNNKCIKHSKGKKLSATKDRATHHSGLVHGLGEKFIVMELCFCTSNMLTITYLLCNPKINAIECLLCIHWLAKVS